MGDKVNLDPQLPAGYELAPNQPTTYTFGSTDGYLTLHLKHKIAEHSALVSLNANVGQAIIGVGYNDFIEVVPEGTELPGSDRWAEYNGTPVANLGEQLVTVKVDEVFHLVVGVVGPSTMTIPELSVDVPTVEALLNGKANGYESYGDYYGVGIKELLGRFVKPSATENGKDIQLEFSQELDDPNLDRLVPHKVVVDSQGNPHLVFGGVADLNHLLVHSEDSDKITLTFAVGLSYIPVYKDVKQRVIEITKPDGKVQTVKQVATLRAGLDQSFYDHQENTHRTVGEWSTGTWEAYTPEEIPGYTPTIKSVDAQTVTEATKDQTVEITYTANPESVKVNYVDDDDNGSVIKTATLNGATDQTVKTNISIPHNYVLKGTAPSEYTFKAGVNADITVHLKHATQDVSDTDPQAKIEREYSIVQKIPQINHDVNGKVTYTTKTLLNDWHFVRQRTATKDLVTGEINYGLWLGFGPGVFESPEFGIDKIDYTKLTSPIGASEQLLMWRAGEPTSESYKKFIDYLGLDPDQFVALVGMADFDGNSGKNEADRERFNEGLKLGTGNFGSGNDNDYNYFKGMIWKAGSSHNHLYLNPSYKDYDKSFDLFYKIGLNYASYDFYNEVLPKSQTIELISQPVDLPVTINYKDTATGEIVGTDSLTTNYYQDFLLPDHTSAGYVAVDPSVFKNARSVRAAGDQLTTTFEIPVHHKMVTVTPDHPKNPNDKLPDNPTKSYPSGVAEADLNKTLTRTIKVTTPDGKTTTISQVAKLTRTAEVDEVTGEVVKYSDWTTGTWGTFTPKEVEGYTPTPEAVAQQAVTADMGDQTVVVTYTADAQTIEVRYVDDDDHEKLVHTNTVTGKSGQTVTITPAAPADYELVDATPITYQVTAQPNQVVTVHVKHQTSTTSESKTLTRTIELHTPFDGVKLIKQVAELTRLVTFDKATGQSTTGAWSTGQWDAYQVPTYAGYAPTIDVVPAVNLTGADKDQTVVVNYQALQHTTHVNYVDENGTLVHTTTLSGKTNEVVTVPTKVTPTKPRAKVVATGKTNEVVTVPTKVTPTKPQAKVAVTGKPVVASRAAAPAQPTPATEQRLPQTGNQATATGQIWGLLAASLATGLGLWHTKKKKQKG
ncbi:mucin-binding protein [Lactobacillus crispatus]|uniref:mucin-binding protein n=1 Tax=Lactobacillus crispatus TaxID=47770 RepID=UPI0030F6984F